MPEGAVTTPWREVDIQFATRSTTGALEEFERWKQRDLAALRAVTTHEQDCAQIVEDGDWVAAPGVGLADLYVVVDG